MKTVFALFLSIFTSIHAQWFPLNSGTSLNLNDVSVIDSQSVFAVGDSGIILKTIDGGENWIQQTPVPVKFNGVSFCDQNNGVVVGEGGILLKTTNGGTSWFTLNSPITEDLTDVWLQDTLRIVILAGNGGRKFAESLDAGESWTVHNIWGYPFDCHFDRMAFTLWEDTYAVISGSGYRVEPPGGLFSMYYRRTGSQTFWDIFTGTVDKEALSMSILPSGKLFGVFYDNRVGVNLWGSTLWEVRGTVTPTGSSHPMDLFFVNDSTGTALFSDAVYHTNDGGWTWQQVFSSKFHSLQFADILVGYTVGDSGKIAKTINGGVVVGVDDYKRNLNFTLAQNYPNPFNPSTTISYSTPVLGKVHLIVYDALGREVRKLVDEEKEAGNYEIKFNADGLASGMYFYRLSAGERVISKKMILLK